MDLKFPKKSLFDKILNCWLHEATYWNLKIAQMFIILILNVILYFFNIIILISHVFVHFLAKKTRELYDPNVHEMNITIKLIPNASIRLSNFFHYIKF